MGHTLEFRCAKCRYTARVSGGRDCGMLAVVQTMTCDDCRKLVDVLIGHAGMDGPLGDPELDKDLNICPNCKGTRVRPWSEERDCPRCGAKMVEHPGVIELWD